MNRDKGILIVFEGTDGSGKSTQFARLCQRMEQEGQAFRRLVYPRYEEDSSALIRMYLRGDFGTDPAAVNPYAATAFYAVDRYASYKTLWEQEYRGGGLMLADRYTTSNAVHQAAKLTGQERRDYLEWLFAFEYDRMGLPAPDLVLYLDLPSELSAQLLRERVDEGKDIHEADLNYLATCRDAALETAALYGWQVIPCQREDGTLASIEEIHGRVWEAVSACLEEQR